jgi:hypothetical protein
MFSFGCFLGVWVLIADVSEPSIGSIFLGRSMQYDGTDRGFRNVGYQHSDAGETPKKTYYKIRPALQFNFSEKDTTFTVSNSGQRLNTCRLRCLFFCVVNAYATYVQMQQITTCAIIMCINRLLIRVNGTVGPTYTKETRAYAITTHVPAHTHESQVTVTL